MTAGKKLPPDPATVVPPISAAVTTTLASAVEFLYTGADPIQTSVVPETIDARRISVVRGRVTNRQGDALPGVTVTIKDHPEFGETLSRADGMFDLAVNGGAVLTLNYFKPGYLPVQRNATTVWQEYTWAPDVVMVKQEESYTAPELPSGSTVTRYDYNLDKDLDLITRPDGQTIDLEYDSAGRLTRQTVPNGAYGYGYDAFTGQLNRIEAPDNERLEFAYDGFLPVSETWSGTINGNVSRSYDNNFWLTRLEVNGQSIAYGYDNDGLLTQAGEMVLTRHGQNGLLIGTSLGRR